MGLVAIAIGIIKFICTEKKLVSKTCLILSAIAETILGQLDNYDSALQVFDLIRR